MAYYDTESSSGSTDRSSRSGAWIRAGKRGNPQRIRSNATDDTLIIKIESRHIGLIVGKDGWRIQDLQHKSGARINIGTKQGSQTEISIIGTVDAQALADQLIKDIISRRERWLKLPPVTKEDLEMSQMTPEMVCVGSTHSMATHSVTQKVVTVEEDPKLDAVLKFVASHEKARTRDNSTKFGSRDGQNSFRTSEGGSRPYRGGRGRGRY